MRLAVDATPLSAERITGTGRYIMSLLSGLAQNRDKCETLVVLADSGTQALLPRDHPFDIHLLTIRHHLGPFAREHARHLALRALCRAEDIDVLHSTLDPVWPMRRTRQVLTVHDVARMDRQAVGLKLNSTRERIRTLIRYGLARRADRIVTISEFSLGRIVKVLHIDPKRVSVVHTGMPEDFAWPIAGEQARLFSEKLGLPSGFVLFVGQFGRQKNETGLLEAWELLDRDTKACGMVLVGNGPAPQNLPNEVKVIDNLSDGELVYLYDQAGALCLPSFYEGFGMPVLEAMTRSLPVVVSQDTSLAEIVGEAGVIVDPHDPQSIASGLVRALASGGNETVKENIRQRAGQFTIERMVDKTIEAYREALKR